MYTVTIRSGGLPYLHVINIRNVSGDLSGFINNSPTGLVVSIERDLFSTW